MGDNSTVYAVAGTRPDSEARPDLGGPDPAPGARLPVRSPSAGWLCLPHPAAPID